MIDATLLAVLLIATLVRSTFGFGEALVSVPLLALFVPFKVAAPVAVLVSITVAGVILRSEVHARSAGWLVLSTLLDTPLGLLELEPLNGQTLYPSQRDSGTVLLCKGGIQ